MNWLLCGVAIFMILSAWDGHRRGFIKKSVGIVSLIITFAVTSAAVPFVSKLLQEKTPLYSVLQNAILSSDTDIFETMELIGLGESVSAYLAQTILQVAAFLITLILVGVLIQGLAFALDIAARLPVLNGINKTAGLILGFAEGLLLIWIIFFLITVCSTTDLGGKLLTMIAQSDILSWLYRKNLLFSLLGIG